MGVGGRRVGRREESGCRREKSGSLEILCLKSSILQTCINFNCVLSSMLL